MIAAVWLLGAILGSGIPTECYDLCFLAMNGVCDDSGPGAVNSLCMYGMDCSDCGPRDPYSGRPSIARIPTVKPSFYVPDEEEFKVVTSRQPSLKAKLTHSPTLKPKRRTRG